MTEGWSHVCTSHHICHQLVPVLHQGLLTEDKGWGASVTSFQRHGKYIHAYTVIFAPASVWSFYLVAPASCMRIRIIGDLQVCECECVRLFVSICRPRDRLVICPGCSLPQPHLLSGWVRSAAALTVCSLDLPAIASCSEGCKIHISTHMSQQRKNKPLTHLHCELWETVWEASAGAGTQKLHK